MINNSTNVVDNVCLWDGNPDTWQPPQNYTMLVQATTPAMVWEPNADNTDYVLTEQIGQGQIGFTWDESVLTTNEPKPEIPAQPITTGMQTL